MSTNIKPFLDDLKKNYAYTKMEVFPVAQTVKNVLIHLRNCFKWGCVLQFFFVICTL